MPIIFYSIALLSCKNVSFFFHFFLLSDIHLLILNFSSIHAILLLSPLLLPPEFKSSGNFHSHGDYAIHRARVRVYNLLPSSPSCNVSHDNINECYWRKTTRCLHATFFSFIYKSVLLLLQLFTILCMIFRIFAVAFFTYLVSLFTYVPSCSFFISHRVCAVSP